MSDLLTVMNVSKPQMPQKITNPPLSSQPSLSPKEKAFNSKSSKIAAISGSATLLVAIGVGIFSKRKVQNKMVDSLFNEVEANLKNQKELYENIKDLFFEGINLRKISFETDRELLKGSHSILDYPGTKKKSALDSILENCKNINSKNLQAMKDKFSVQYDTVLERMMQENNNFFDEFVISKSVGLPKRAKKIFSKKVLQLKEDFLQEFNANVNAFEKKYNEAIELIVKQGTENIASASKLIEKVNEAYKKL